MNLLYHSLLLILIPITNSAFANDTEQNVIDVSLTTQYVVSQETTSESITEQDDVNHVPTVPETTIKTTPKPNPNEIDNPKYSRGHFGGYYLVDIDDAKFYVHGKYQHPVYNYYGNYKHDLDDQSTLGYYLGYAMRKMDHNEYFQHNNFTHFDVHHFFYRNSTMLPKQLIGSDQLVLCAQNTSTFCPENTEALCLQNSRVWCATKSSHVQTCGERNCVSTRLPCVKSDDANCKNYVEVVKLPCISNITIQDVYADKHGLTFNNVAGTFILAPTPPEAERSYCVTIVAEPRKDS